MARIILYYHYGAYNHGCEAIVRSTKRLIDSPLIVFSLFPKEDKEFGLDQIVELKEDDSQSIRKYSKAFFAGALEFKIKHTTERQNYYHHQKFFDSIKPGDICLSVGGDDYCYPGVELLADYNRILHKKGAKTVLWGCSIEPSVMTPAVIEDLKKYDLITARESLTVEALYAAGIRDNVCYCADPAFQLGIQHCNFESKIINTPTIGINISPLIIGREPKPGIVNQNIEILINWILEHTNYNIALIPHVVKRDSDDRTALDYIHQKYNTERLYTVEDRQCEELKACISKLHLLITARTHASIAAYSTGVPTLVLGYSIKARGIAKDIFGTLEHYVLPVQSLNNSTDILDEFIWLETHYAEVKSKLENTMPDYRKRSFIAAEELEKLMESKK